MTERSRRSIALLLVLSLAVGLGLAGCKPPTDGGTVTDQAVKGGTLNFHISEPGYIDPFNVSESEGISVTTQLFDGLVDFDPITSKIMPAVAEKWEGNTDATVWTFHLRKGTKFHNGREVVAEDFKYAWDRVANPANKSDVAYYLEPVKGYEEVQAGTAKSLSGVVAKDKYTLVVTLNYPFADFEYVTGHPFLSPVPKEEVEKDPKAFLEKPIGNGPFMMAEPWNHQQSIKTKAFADYYGDKPNVDGVTFKIFKDDEAAYTDFKQGNLDFCTIPVGQLKAAAAQYGTSPDGYTMNPGKAVLTGSELSTYYIWMNTTDANLKNVKLRRAIALAINAQAICDVVYEGTRLPASGPVPAGIAGYQKDAWKYNHYDVAAAKKMLADAGYANGQGLPELALSFNGGRGHEKVMAMIQADLDKIGVKVKLDAHPWETYSTEWMKVVDGKFGNADVHQLMRLGWLADYPIMDNFLYNMFFSKSGDDKALYVNADVDALLLKARATADGDARIEIYREIEKKVGEDQPMVALLNYRHTRVGSDRVHGLVFSAMGIPVLNKAWLSQPATPAK